MRELEMVSKHRYLILILDLFKIITAYKIGRPDLIGKTRIFTITKSVDFYLIFPEIIKKDDFQVLLPNYSWHPTFSRP
ncbi:MAG: hypothetical protein ACTSQP_21055 [Promethearchaeota archaeon]